MSTKTPIYLKSSRGRNVNARSGKKVRELLSSEMISLPLGDFRHTAHVGRGTDDVFGDTTFLQPNSSNSNENNTNGSSAKESLRKNGLGKGRKKRSGKSSGRPLSNQSYDGHGPMESPTLQSAISLPMLNHQSALSTAASSTKSKHVKGKKVKKNLYGKIAYNKTKSHETGLNCLSLMAADEFPYQERLQAETTVDGATPNDQNTAHCGQTPKAEAEKPDPTLTESDQLSVDDSWGFDLDLGPSLLDEVLSELNKSEK